MSSGRCTKDSATQSKPSSMPKLRSAWSFSVMAEIGSTALGTFTPLRSESPPPLTTVVSAKSGPQRSTRSRMRPSSSSSSCPGCSTAKISGWGRLARLLVALRLVEVEAEVRRRGLRVTRPSAKRPTRSFGPCRSMIVPIGRPRVLLDLAHEREPRRVVLVAAVAEVEAEHVGAGVGQLRGSAPWSSSPAPASRRSSRNDCVACHLLAPTAVGGMRH